MFFLRSNISSQAGLAYEHVLGENKYTFVKDCANQQSVTILTKGPNKHTLMQIKDAVRDGVRAVKNAAEDGCVVPGAGTFEVATSPSPLPPLSPPSPQVLCHATLKRFLEGKARLGIQAYADGLMVIPNSQATLSTFPVTHNMNSC